MLDCDWRGDLGDVVIGSGRSQPMTPSLNALKYALTIEAAASLPVKYGRLSGREASYLPTRLPPILAVSLFAIGTFAH